VEPDGADCVVREGVGGQIAVVVIQRELTSLRRKEGAQTLEEVAYMAKVKPVLQGDSICEEEVLRMANNLCS